nr:MAG TPA: hypothetical protein [Caudoviricetes sp.]DAY75301.1 MAG TPA: hypothetical protein [Caudoviricetes sp.]
MLCVASTGLSKDDIGVRKIGLTHGTDIRQPWHKH